MEYLILKRVKGWPGRPNRGFINDLAYLISHQKSAGTREEKEEKDKKYTRKEYSYSSFSRTFTIPEGTRTDKIDARYEDGVLKLLIPKTEETRKLEAKHIAVK